MECLKRSIFLIYTSINSSMVDSFKKFVDTIFGVTVTISNVQEVLHPHKLTHIKNLFFNEMADGESMVADYSSLFNDHRGSDSTRILDNIQVTRRSQSASSNNSEMSFINDDDTVGFIPCKTTPNHVLTYLPTNVTPLVKLLFSVYEKQKMAQQALNEEMEKRQISGDERVKEVHNAMDCFDIMIYFRAKKILDQATYEELLERLFDNSSMKIDTSVAINQFHLKSIMTIRNL